jgi:thiol-disulfide isomerase/thioredoxin
VATLSLLCVVALAGVFFVSAIAKLTDREGTRQAVAGFGVPARRVRVVAALLAPVELAVAVALVIPATMVAGLIAALLLLAGFTRAIAVAMREGRRPDCHCFGRIGGADISGRTAARNTALAALAGVGLVARDGSPADLGAGQVAAAVAGGAALAVVIIGIEGFAGRAARLRRERTEALAFEQRLTADDLPPAVVPDFSLPTLAGDQVSRDDLVTNGGRPTLLVFLSSGCGPCKVLRSSALRWFEAYDDRLRVAVVAPGDAAANRDDYPADSGLTVLLDAGGGLRDAFGISGGPAAILLDTDARVMGPVAYGEALVRRLLSAALLGVDFQTVDFHTGDALDETGAAAESISRESVLRPRETVTSSPGEQGVVLVDETTGASVSLDGIGSVVWSVLDGTSPLGEIVDDLAVAFGAPREVVERDTLELTRSLGRVGLFEGIAAGPPPAYHDREADSARNRPVPPHDHQIPIHVDP